MIATLIEPVHYDRLAAMQFYLCIGGAVLALFVILALWCVAYGALRGFATRWRDR